MRDFRTDRLGKILGGEPAHRLVPGPVLVVHFVPTQAALGLVQVNPVPYSDARYLPLLGASGGHSRLNVDGALCLRNPKPEGTNGYSQFFRSGFFEATKVLPPPGDGGKANLPSLAYEEQVITLLKAFRDELGYLGVSDELAVMLSILSADDVRLGVSRQIASFMDDHQALFDRKTVILPDVLVSTGVAAEVGLKPVFDLVWQAAGFPGSLNYNDKGHWAPHS